MYLAGRAVLARHARRLRHLLEELARNARIALAVCLARPILVLTGHTVFARHGRRLPDLLEEPARNTRCALAA